MGFGTRLHSAGMVFQQMGAASFLTRVLPWSLRRDYSIFAQNLDVLIAFPPPTFPCLIRSAGRDDIPAIRALQKGYYARDILLGRLEAGYMGFLGWSGEDLIYIQWIFTGTFAIPYLHGRLALGQKEAYSDEVFTRPDFRGAGVYAHASFLVRKSLREKGFRRLYAAVASWNSVPRQNMIRSGMMEIAEFRRQPPPIFGKWRWSGGIETHDDGTFSFRFEAPR